MADDTTDLTGDRADRGDLDGPPGLDDGALDELDDAYPPPRDLSREAALVSAGLSVVAGVLCIVAPFRAVYTLRASGISASFDGWGRYDLATASQHGPRYGVALTVAAIVLVVAAASRLRDLRPVARDIDAGVPGDTDTGTAVSHTDTGAGTPGEPPANTGDDRLAAAVGIAGSALLLGVLGSVALNIESTVSNAGSIADSGGQSTAVDVGAMLWLLVGGWVVSLLALYVPWFEARRRG